MRTVLCTSSSSSSVVMPLKRGTIRPLKRLARSSIGARSA